MSVKAKFLCNKIIDYGDSKAAHFSAIEGKVEENKDFTEDSPSGFLTIKMDNDTPLSTYFMAGEEYFLTFEEAPEDNELPY